MDKAKMDDGAAIYKTISLMIHVAPEAAMNMLLKLQKGAGYAFIIQREPPSIEVHHAKCHLFTYDGTGTLDIFDAAKDELDRINRVAGKTVLSENDVIQAFCMFSVLTAAVEVAERGQY